jgi:GNAT superfamily N-acetyltransferase
VTTDRIFGVAIVRNARLADAEAVAEVHVESWKATYRGIFPDEYLDGLAAVDRLPMWQDLLGHGPDERLSVLVVEDNSGAVCGFALSRPADEAESAELSAIYLHPRVWRKGLGRLLHQRLVTRLRSQGYAEAILWVHPGNDRARRFYEACGWADDGAERTETVWGIAAAERRYRLRLL